MHRFGMSRLIKSNAILETFFSTFFGISDHTNGNRVVVSAGWDGISTNLELFTSIFWSNTARATFFVRILDEERSPLFVPIELVNVLHHLNNWQGPGLTSLTDGSRPFVTKFRAIGYDNRHC